MKTVFRYGLAVFIFLLFLIPFYMLFSLAGKTPMDTSSMWLPPRYIQFDNYLAAWNKAHLGRALLNNAVITAFSVFFIVGVGAAAAYPLARKRNPKEPDCGDGSYFLFDCSASDHSRSALQIHS